MTRRVKEIPPYSSSRSEDIAASAAYAIGYRKPPTGTRFKPGTSGNPNGRPKGKRNVGTDIRDVYTGEVVIREGGKTRRVTRLVALLRKQIDRAFTGDEHAVLTSCKIAAQLGLFEVPKETVKKVDLDGLSVDELVSVRQIFSKLARIEADRSKGIHDSQPV